MNPIKIKILGSGPTGSLLALSLASNNCNVFLIEPLSDEELLLKDKGYAITQSSKKIFDDLGLWKFIKEYAVGFNSLSIIDSVISQEVIVRQSDLKTFNKNEENIGWVIEHKYLMMILINEINQNQFIKKFKSDSTNNQIFNFILAADGRNSSTRKSWQITYLKRFYNQKCISFQAKIKGADNKRAYEIFRDEGPLALLPLKNNIYQVIWFSSLKTAQAKLKLSNKQLINILSGILPHKLNCESIISEISNFNVAQAFAMPSFKNFKNILVGDSAHSFHPVGGQGLNSCIRDMYELSIMINNFNNLSVINQRFFSINFFFKRFFDIISLIFFTDFLIKLFSNKYIILLPLRNLIFIVLRKNKFFRKNLFSLMTDSIKRYDFEK